MNPITNPQIPNPRPMKLETPRPVAPNPDHLPSRLTRIALKLAAAARKTSPETLARFSGLGIRGSSGHKKA